MQTVISKLFACDREGAMVLSHAFHLAVADRANDSAKNTRCLRRYNALRSWKRATFGLESGQIRWGLESRVRSTARECRCVKAMEASWA